MSRGEMYAAIGHRRVPASVALALLLSLSYCSGHQPLRQIPFEQRKVILFSNFQNNSPEARGKSTDGLTRGIPAIILNDFLNLGLFRAVSAEHRRKALQELAFQQSGLTSDSTVEFGKLAGGEFLLTGSFFQTEQTTTIEAQVVEISTGETIASGVASGPNENILFPPERALIKQLSLQLLTRFDPSISPSERAALIAQIETNNVEAANHNYHGELLLEEKEKMQIKSEVRREALDKNKVKEIETAAKHDFEEALRADAEYDKAKLNLQKLVSLLPPAY